MPFLLAAVALPPASAAPVPAGPAPKQLAELPVAADSMVVLHLNGLDRTRERLTKMLAGIDAEMAKKAAKQLDELITSTLDGRDIKSVSGTGRLFLAVGDVAQLQADEAPVALSIPVPDYAAFRQKFLTGPERKSFERGKDGVDQFELAGAERSMYLVSTDGYVVATFNKAMAEKYAGKFDKLTVKKLGAAADGFLGADLSVFLNLEMVNEKYGMEIKQGRALIGLLLQQGGMGFDKQQLATAKAFLESLFQLVEDGRGMVLGIDLRPEGAALRLDGRFDPDSETGKLAAKEKPTALVDLGDLPKGMMMYTATKWGLNFGKFLPEYVASPGDDKSEEAIEAYAKLVADNGTDSVSVSPGLQSTLNLRTTKDANAASDGLLKVMKRMQEGASYSNVLLKGKPEVTEAAQKAHGFSLHHALVKLDFEATAEKIGNEVQKEAALASMKRLSPEKVNLWFGSDGKRFVTVTARNWDEAKKLLDGVVEKKAKVSDDPAFASVRKQLAPYASSITLFDAAKGLTFLAEYAEGLGGVLPLPVDFPKIAKLEGDTAYIGFAIGLKEDAARLDLFVPGEAVKLLMKAIKE